MECFESIYGNAAGAACQTCRETIPAAMRQHSADTNLPAQSQCRGANPVPTARPQPSPCTRVPGQSPGQEERPDPTPRYQPGLYNKVIVQSLTIHIQQQAVKTGSTEGAVFHGLAIRTQHGGEDMLTCLHPLTNCISGPTIDNSSSRKNRRKDKKIRMLSKKDPNKPQQPMLCLGRSVPVQVHKLDTAPPSEFRAHV